MSVLIERKRDSGITGAGEEKRSAVDFFRCKRRPAGSLRLRVFRKEKVLEVRRELDAGRYAVNEHLSIAADKLIEDIMRPADMPARVPSRKPERR